MEEYEGIWINMIKMEEYMEEEGSIWSNMDKY
jgi:hypothetical protein